MNHEKAVKRIVWYLRQTRDNGLILQVNTDKGIECFVDADFASRYQRENPINLHNCLSQTGMIIKFANCPIIWFSKLQTTIALSTTEAKNMALSAAVREVVYLYNFTKNYMKKE